MKLSKSVIYMAMLLALPSLAVAEDVPEASSISEAITEGTFSGNLKFRYEHVNQAGFKESAEAITLRTLVGYQTKPLNGFSVNAEIYGLSPFNDNYNDIKKGDPIDSRKIYPVIADPEDYDFHQIYAQFKNKEHQVRLGRQSVILDNWRFIGDVRFRQNWQVMNGLSYVNTSLPNTTITAAHMEQVKQITTKIQNANIEILNAKYAFTPTTSLSGYGYLIDWDGRALEATSSKTFGLRFVGDEKINEEWKGLLTAEYAKQDDYKDGNEDIDNYYYWIGGGLGYQGWFLTLNQEKLSGNRDNRAFQTPLGTNHLFQGWTDLFLVTPNQGIEDTILIAGGQFMGAVIKAEYHIIKSDRDFNTLGGGQGDEFGKELDLGIYYKFNKQVAASLEYGQFKEGDLLAAGRKRDVEKLWLTAMYSF